MALLGGSAAVAALFGGAVAVATVFVGGVQVWPSAAPSQPPVVTAWTLTESAAHSTSQAATGPSCAAGNLLVASVRYGRRWDEPIALHPSFVDSGAGIVGDINSQMRVMWRAVQVGDPASYTFSAPTASNSGAWVIGLYCVAGADSLSPIDVIASSTGSGTAPSNPSVNTTGPDRLVFYFEAADASAVGVVPVDDAGLPGNTDLYHREVAVDAATGQVVGGTSHKPLPAQGPSGAATWTLSVSETWETVTVAFKPSSGSSGAFFDDTYCEATECPGTPRIDNTNTAYEYQNGGGDSYGTGLVFNREDGAIWDSRGSTWKFNNCRHFNPTDAQPCSSLPSGVTERQISKLPILVRGTNNGRWQGGNINGLNPLDKDWNESYWNAVGMRVDTSANFTVEGVRFDRVWDGIKFVDGAQDYTLRDSWISRARDDCVETGGAHSGVVRDSLFEGCFAGFDSDPGNDYTGASREATELQQFHGVLLRMGTYLYEDSPRQGHLFKTHDSSPSISLHNSVLAPSRALEAYSRTQRAWQRMTNAYGSCSNNLFLWLGSGSPPAGFLTGMPACFTVVEGQAAQDLWAAARQNWIDCHPAIARATDAAGDGIPPNDPASNTANCVKGTWGGYD